MSGKPNMLRVRNVHTARVAKIERGMEGDVADSAAIRAMLKGGLLVLVSGDISGPVPVPEAPAGAMAAEMEAFGGLFVRESDARKMIADIDGAARMRVQEMADELDKVRGMLAQVSADRDDLAARLEAAEKALQAAAGGAAGSSESAPSAPAEKAPKGKDKG